MPDQKKKYLILKGCAGLGNRVMTICAAIEYCKRTNRILFVDWSDGLFGEPGVNVFRDFFSIREVPQIFRLSEIKNFNSLSHYPAVWGRQPEKNLYDLYMPAGSSFLSKLPKKLFPFLRLKMLRSYWKFKTDPSQTEEFGTLDTLFSLFRPNDLTLGGDLPDQVSYDVLFYADYRPDYSEDIFLKHFSLEEKIEARVNELAREWNLKENVIGINVRSTDKKPSNSIDSLFRRIDSMPLKSPRIYLSTDNKDILEMFKKRYPGLLFYDRFLPDVTTEGIHQWSLLNKKPEFARQILYDSIMQLWLLSRCEYLLYQGNSSFSLLAKILHGDRKKSTNWDV